MAEAWQGRLEVSFEVTMEPGIDPETLINDLTQRCEEFLDERRGVEVRNYQSGAVSA